MPRDLSTCCVRETDSILHSLKALDSGGVGIVLVVGSEQRLSGILTDGDLRRALLSGAELQASVSPFVQRNFIRVGADVGRTEVLDLMQSRLIRQIPIVSESGRLQGLHLLHEIIGAVERPNWAVIMAGGKGTRLAPITESVPKPMIRVAGRPILERLVLHLVGFGIRRIFLSINHLARLIQDYFRDGQQHGCRIEYLHEQEPLGTGGALSQLKERPTDPLIVMNGDLVTQANVDDLLTFHSEGRFVATVGAKQYLHEIPFGCLETEGERVIRLEEKPILERLVNAGIYVVDPLVLDYVPAGPYSMTALIGRCLSENMRVGVFTLREDWIDVGQHEQLRRAREGKP